MGNSPILHRMDIPISEYREWSGSGVALWWLGQAGFLIRYGKLNIIIDAYLSDSLAHKYKGEVYPHIRMMPPPISIEKLTDIDYFISTHSHSDHMDPGLIPAIRDTNPDCRFIIPEAARITGLERGIPRDRLTGVDAGNDMTLSEDVSLSIIPSAHEALKQDGLGHHHYLGFIISLGDLKIYHSGDCIAYSGYDTWLKPHRVDLALMPVNGRKDELSRQGIAGNFNFSQSVDIMRKHRIQFMIPHHYGMFDFNTVEMDELEAGVRDSGLQDRIFPAETGTMYSLKKE